MFCHMKGGGGGGGEEQTKFSLLCKEKSCQGLVFAGPVCFYYLILIV